MTVYYFFFFFFFLTGFVLQGARISIILYLTSSQWEVVLHFIIYGRTRTFSLYNMTFVFATGKLEINVVKKKYFPTLVIQA